jgi:putative flippase GtrA
LLGQGVRFATAGGAVALVYAGVTTLLSSVVGMAFQAALAIGFGAALVVHFTLQRAFVWTHERDFALPLRKQAARYLLASAVQYGLTAASTSLLPSALELSAEVVYLLTMAIIVVVNFVVFRHGIFHEGGRETESEPVRIPPTSGLDL